MRATQSRYGIIDAPVVPSTASLRHIHVRKCFCNGSERKRCTDAPWGRRRAPCSALKSVGWHVHDVGIASHLGCTRRMRWLIKAPTEAPCWLPSQWYVRALPPAATALVSARQAVHSPSVPTSCSGVVRDARLSLWWLSRMRPGESL